MSSLTNISINSRSMNGIIVISDGVATMENGDITANDINVGDIVAGDINAGIIQANSFSTLNKSLLETVITIATSSTPYTWAYNTAQNIVFTGTTSQIFNLPVVTNANLGTTITIFRTASASFNINPATGYNLYDFNNAVLTTRPLNTVDRVITLTAISSGATQWQMSSQSPNQLITAILSQTQTFSGLKIFNNGLNITTVAGQTSVTPLVANDLVNKNYADSVGTTLLSSNNTWSGTNQFNNNLTMGTAGYFLPYFPLSSTSLRIGLNTLKNSTLLSINNVCLGNGAMQGTTNTAYNNIFTNSVVLGNGAMSGLIYGTTTTSNNDNVFIGYNCAKNACLNSNDNVIIGSSAVGGNIGTLVDNVIIGSKINTNSGFPTYSTIIGAKNFPNTAINYGTIIGYGNFLYTGLTYGNGGVVLGSQNLQYCDAFNNVICVGAQSLNNLFNDYSTICIGVSSLNSLTTGTGVICLGSYSNCSNDQTNTTLLGVWSNANSTYHNNAVYFGGNDNNNIYQDLLIAKKNRIYCLQSFVSPLESVINVEFETQEYVLIDNSVITTILLPNILNIYSIGATFTFFRGSSGTSQIIIDSQTGFYIQSSFGLNQTFTWSSYSSYIKLVVVNITTWSVVSNDIITKIKTVDTSTNSNFYLSFVSSNINGSYQEPRTNSTLKYNPSTGNLQATTFTGSVSGTSTNANNINTATDTTSTNLYLTMGTASSGFQSLKTNTNLLYNSLTNILTLNNLTFSTTLKNNNKQIYNEIVEITQTTGTYLFNFGTADILRVRSTTANINIQLQLCFTVNKGTRIRIIKSDTAVINITIVNNINFQNENMNSISNYVMDVNNNVVEMDVITTNTGSIEWYVAYSQKGNPSITSLYQLVSDMSNYLTTSVASSTYQTIANMSNYLTTSVASSTYQTITDMTNYVSKSLNETITGEKTFTNQITLNSYLYINSLYFMNRVKPSNLTGGNNALFVAPFYEYNLINPTVAANIYLPNLSTFPIGHVLRFRRITTSNGASVSVFIQTGAIINGVQSVNLTASQFIIGRNSITQTSSAVILNGTGTNITYGSVLALSTSSWAILE